MSTTTLTLKERPHVPLEAELLTPDVIAPLTHEEVRALPVVLGKRQRAQLRVAERGDRVGREQLRLQGDVRALLQDQRGRAHAVG